MVFMRSELPICVPFVDMSEKLSALARLFADDTAVYKTISNGHNQAQLQEDLQRLADWEESRDMEFHPAKCQTLSITRSRKPLQPSYVLYGHTLENVSSAKYLGVTINNTVSWDDHTSNTGSKANRVLGFLRRNLKISASNIKEKSYKVFVRPLLEYAASVWDPCSQKNIAKIEAVQRRAARFVLNRFRNTSSVNNMLEALGWPTLEQRRQTCRLLMLYKIQSGPAHCPTLKAELVRLPSRQRRTHDKQLTLLTTRTHYRGSSFLPKTIRDWNSLPMKVVEAPTLDAFESRV